MLISERYSEYGITGAFFWIIQIFMLIKFYDDSPLSIWQNWMSEIAPFFSAIPDILQVSVAGVLGAIGIMAIFIAGLLLDLLGILLSFQERIVFTKQLIQSKFWLQPFTEKNKSFLGSDYEILISSPESLWHSEKNHTLKSFLRIFFFKSRRDVNRYREAFSRLQSLLISNVMIYSDTSKLEFFNNHIHLWRTTRELCVAVYVFTFEFGIIFTHGQNHGSLYGFILISINLILVILSTIILRLSYSRMCSTLFALLYLIEEQKKKVA